MMLNKIQEQFSRIVMYMENMDNRLSRLESVTRDILDNSRKAPSEPISSSSIRPNPSPSPAASYREPPSDSFKVRKKKANRSFLRPPPQPMLTRTSRRIRTRLLLANYS